MLLIDRSSKDNHRSRVQRDDFESLLRRVDRRRIAKCASKAADLYAQARAMRFVREARAERASEEYIAGGVSRPRFRQGSGEREQDWPGGERNHRIARADCMPAG